jgi:hypothetical protein
MLKRNGLTHGGPASGPSASYDFSRASRCRGRYAWAELCHVAACLSRHTADAVSQHAWGMITNDRGHLKPSCSRCSYRGASATYYTTLVVRALDPVFVSAVVAALSEG